MRENFIRDNQALPLPNSPPPSSLLTPTQVAAMKGSPELKAAPPRREVNLKGPRPSPLKVSKDSNKIKKAAAAPPSRHPAAAAPPRGPIVKPIVIYAVSPKIFHAEPGDFMTLVQRLTGASPSAAAPPAKAVAAERRSVPSGGDAADEVPDLLGIVRQEAAEGSFPGILSPLPTALPSVSTGFYSWPEADPSSPPAFLLSSGDFLFIPTPPSLSLSPGAYWDVFGHI